MWMRPNVERIARLNLGGFEVGDDVMFCPDCEFQYDAGCVGRPECPDCGTALHTNRVTENVIGMEIK